MAAVSLPLFVLFEQGSAALDLVATIIFAIVFSLQEGVATVVLTEQLPPRVRGTAFATSFNVAAAVFGGVSPMLATILIAETGIDIAPSALIMAAALVSAIAFWFCKPAPSTARDPASGSPAVAR